MTRKLIALLVIGALLGPTLSCVCPVGQPGTTSQASVQIAQPAAGTTLAPGQAVPIVAVASDPAGLTRLEVEVDGAILVAQTSPQPAPNLVASTTWSSDTTGHHVILARAFNAKGQTTQSVPVVVQVQTTAAQAEEVLIPQTTKVLSGTTPLNLASVSEDGSTFTFAKTDPQLQSLKPGDVIVGDVSVHTPDGFLRRVAQVQPQGDGVVVVTQPARLEDAIEQGSLSVSRALKPGDVRAGFARPGVVLASLAPMTAPDRWVVTLTDVVLYDGDGNPNTTNDQIRANGEIAFEPRLDFELRIRWFKIQKIALVTGATESINLRVQGEAQLLNVHKEVQVAYYPLQPITFFIGPVPLVLTPVLNVVVGLDGSAQVGFVAGVTQQASLSVGLRYENGRWSPVSDFTNNFSYTPPQVTGKLRVEAYGGLQLAVLIYGVSGPWGSLNAYYGLDADIQRVPPWELYGGLRCQIGVRFAILGYRIADYSTTVLDRQAKIAEASPRATDTPAPTATQTPPPPSNHAPIITSFTAEPQTVPAGGSAALAVSAYDPDGDPLSYSWNVEGNRGSITGWASAAYTAPGEPSRSGPVTITAIVSDSKGAVATRSVVVTVVRPAGLYDPGPAFQPSWAGSPVVQDRLGWAIEQQRNLPSAGTDIRAVEQPFERGRMFWYSDVRLIYSLYTDDHRWQVFNDTFSWADPSPTPLPPTGCTAPMQGGFRKVWWNEPNVRARLGCPLQGEQAVNGTIQLFQHGVMIKSGLTGQVFVLFSDNGTWQ